MRLLAMFLLAFSIPVLFSQTSFSQSPASRPFYKNPLAMTISQTLAGPDNDTDTRARIRIFPGREKTFLLEENRDLRFTYNLQPDRSAPLVFVIPGTGGN